MSGVGADVSVSAAASRRSGPRLTGPDQDPALLIHRHALAVVEFLLQVLRPPRQLDCVQRAIGQTTSLAQQGDHLIQNCDKVHPISSLPRALPVCACATPS